jgi:hypothetical protein
MLHGVVVARPRGHPIVYRHLLVSHFSGSTCFRPCEQSLAAAGRMLGPSVRRRPPAIHPQAAARSGGVGVIGSSCVSGFPSSALLLSPSPVPAIVVPRPRCPLLIVAFVVPVSSPLSSHVRAVVASCPCAVGPVPVVVVSSWSWLSCCRPCPPIPPGSSSAVLAGN